jgi:hypothetical protein
MANLGESTSQGATDGMALQPSIVTMLKSEVLAAVMFSLMLFAWASKIPAPLVDGGQIWAVVGLFLVPWYFLYRPQDIGLFLFIWAVSFLILCAHLTLSWFTTGYAIDARSVLVAVVFTMFMAFVAAFFSRREHLQAVLLLAMKIAIPIVFVPDMLDLFGVPIGIRFHTYIHYFLPIYRPTGIMGEPSFIGVFLATPIFLMIVYPKIWQSVFGLPYTVMIVLIGFFSPSSTLVCAVAIALIFRFVRGITSLSRLFRHVVLPAVMLVVIAVSLPDTTSRAIGPVAERFASISGMMNGEGSNKLNASGIILATAVLITRDALVSHPLGFGIDRYVYANDAYGLNYSSVFYLAQNNRDGTSLLTKVLVEYGIFSILGFCILAFSLSRRSRGRDIEGFDLSISIASLILLTNCIRCAGYLFGGVVLAAGILVGLCLGPRSTESTI